MSLPLRTPAAGPSDSLDLFMARARPRLDEALRATVDAIPGALGPVNGVASRALGVEGRQGRRWRPFLTLAAADAVGGTVSDAMDAAVAVELTHTASLVLDDMPCMDDSTCRRGEPSTHSLVGSAGAILLAIGLLARAAELLGRTPGCGGELSSFWGRTFGFNGMSGGQAVDLTRRGEATGEVRRLYRRKTTSLAMFAVEAGAIVGGADDPVRRHLRGFGQDLGWAYQLVDDVKDLAEDRSLGRSPHERNPMRHARRLLNRGLGRLDHLGDLRPGGRELLGDMARDVVGIPTLMAVNPQKESAPC